MREEDIGHPVQMVADGNEVLLVNGKNGGRVGNGHDGSCARLPKSLCKFKKNAPALRGAGVLS